MAKNNVVVIVSGQDNTGATFNAIQEHLKEVERRAHDADSAVAQLGERFTRALEYTGIYFGIHEIVDGFKEMVKSAMDTGVEIGHLSKQTGISSENLSVLKYAAQETGVEFETLVKGFKKLSTELYDYDHGSKQAQQAFSALGISGKQLAETHGDLYAVFGLVADRMQAMPDGYEKSAAASMLFGRAGQQLIPVLNEGSAGVAKFRSEAEDLGLVLDSSTVEKMEELHKTVAQMQGGFEGLALEITSALAPALERMTKDATELVRALATSPADAFKLMESNLISNLPMFGPAAAAMKARGEQLRSEALADINSNTAAKTAADNADSVAHTGKGSADPTFVDPEAAKKLAEARAKAAEALRQAQGRTGDTSGYRNVFRAEEMNSGEIDKGIGEAGEASIKGFEKESEAAIKASKAEIEALKQVQEGRIQAATQAYELAERTANFEMQQGRISADQRASILRDAAANELDIKQNALSMIAGLDSINPDNPEKVQKDLNEIEQVKAAHTERMLELDQQEMERRAETMDGLLHKVFDPFIDKPKSIQAAFHSMVDGILSDLERMGEQKLIQSLVNGMQGGSGGASGAPMGESLGLPAGGALGKLLGAFGLGKHADVAANGGLATGAGTHADAIASALQQGKGDGSGGGVVVNLITQGTPQTVDSSGSSGGDGKLEQAIVSIVLKDADTGGPMSVALAGAAKMFGGG